MDRDLRLGAPDRGAARPPYPSCPYPRNERRKFSPQSQPRAENGPRRPKPNPDPLGPPHPHRCGGSVLLRPLVWFLSALDKTLAMVHRNVFAPSMPNDTDRSKGTPVHLVTSERDAAQGAPAASSPLIRQKEEENKMKCFPDSARQTLLPALTAWTRRMQKTVAYLVLLVFMKIMMVASADAQEQKTVNIIGYTHGACLVDGKKLRPVYADNGLVSTTSAGAYWNCENVINSGIIWCKKAVRLNYSWQNEKYTKCLEIFESWVPECISHYESQRGKCEETLQKASGKNDSADCKFAKQTFADYQSACNGGDSNACGILPQALAIVEQTCR